MEKPLNPVSPVWSTTTILMGIFYPIAVIVLNKNLPRWSGFDTSNPMVPVLLHGTTLIGLLVVVGTVLLYKLRFANSYAIGMGAIITSSILTLIACALLFINGHVWYGLYKL